MATRLRRTRASLLSSLLWKPSEPKPSNVLATKFKQGLTGSFRSVPALGPFHPNSNVRSYTTLSRPGSWVDRVAEWNDIQADSAIRKGLPIESAIHLQSLLQLSKEKAARLIGRSRSTYARYQNQDADLDPSEAERVVRYARLVSLATEILNGQNAAVMWMKEPNIRLGGHLPLQMAETAPGARIVQNLLVGIQHGHIA